MLKSDKKLTGGNVFVIVNDNNNNNNKLNSN